MDRKISVIVPCYKVEDYLPQCIDSIIGQTYKSLEIILVDDGSPDKCPQICDSYAQKDSRIKVIHKKNGGLSSARNAGLAIASSDFIAFVDSDDWLEPEMYESMMRIMINENCDVVTCGVNKCVDGVNNDLSQIDHNNIRIDKYYGEEVFERLMIEKYNIRTEVWNKIYKREVISDIIFKEGQIYEDLYFDRMIFSQPKKVAVANASYYNYRVNRPGSTNSFFKKNRFSVFQELDDYIKMFKDRNRKDLVDFYEARAADFAVLFYIQANELHADKELIKKTCAYFNKYKNKNNKYFTASKKCRLMAISPVLLLAASRISGLIRVKK